MYFFTRSKLKFHYMNFYWQRLKVKNGIISKSCHSNFSIAFRNFVIWMWINVIVWLFWPSLTMLHWYCRSIVCFYCQAQGHHSQFSYSAVGVGILYIIAKSPDSILLSPSSRLDCLRRTGFHGEKVQNPQSRRRKGSKDILQNCNWRNEGLIFLLLLN